MSPSAGPKVSLRFDAPAVFEEFCEQTIARGLLDAAVDNAPVPGAWVVIEIFPPGIETPLVVDARVVHRGARDVCRLRFQCSEAQRAWLSGFLAGVHATPAPQASEAATVDDPQGLFDRLDDLTYYELLGAPVDAPDRDLQLAFHALSRQYHPDLFHGVAAERRDPVARVYRRLNEAYSVLRSPARRRSYDRGLAGPRHSWRLRWNDETPQPTSRDPEPTERHPRGAHYAARANQRLALPRPRHAGPEVEVIRLLRTAALLEPENQTYRDALTRVMTGAPGALVPPPRPGRAPHAPGGTARPPAPPTKPAEPGIRVTRTPRHHDP